MSERLEKKKLYSRFIYWFTRYATYFIFSSIWRLKISGEENIPAEGSVLFAANHISNVDPPLVGSTLKKPIHYFAKEELFRIPFIGWYITHLNSFPVRRFDHDIGAFKKAQQILLTGGRLLLFPEGQRSKTGEIGQAKAGIGMLAYKTRTPVIPICVQNSEKFSSFKKLYVTFGKPLYPPKPEGSKQDYQDFSDEVMRSIAELKSKMYNVHSS